MRISHLIIVSVWLSQCGEERPASHHRVFYIFHPCQPSHPHSCSKCTCPAHTCPVSRVLSNGGLVHVSHITSIHKMRVGGPPALCLVFWAIEDSFMHTTLFLESEGLSCPHLPCVSGFKHRGTHLHPPHCLHVQNMGQRPTHPLSCVSSNRGLIYVH